MPTPTPAGDLLALLNEAYVFIAMKHRACDPWRNVLDDWQARVEKQTGWTAFDQIEKSRANAKDEPRRARTNADTPET